MTDKSRMFWGNKDTIYSDGHSIPWATYQCKGVVAVVGTTKYTTLKHSCKLVTDHPHGCLCICGIRFNDKEAVT